MEKESSFFDRLTFDPRLNTTFIARYFSNVRTIILIVLTLTGAGLATFFSLPKELNPNIQIPIIFVSTPFPGAGPEDVESLVTIPLEDALNGLSGVSKLTSTSQENISTLSIEFNSDVDPQKAKDDVQGAIDTVTDLPKDAEKSKIEVLDFENQPVLTFVLSGQADGQTLTRFSDELEDRIKNLPGIEKVNMNYRNAPDVEIVLRPEVIREKNLNIAAVGQTLQAALGNYPAGDLSTGQTSFALTQETFAGSLSDLRTLPLRLGGEVIPLGEVALVREAPAPNALLALYADNATESVRAITFSVFKSDSADTGETVTSVLELAGNLQKKYAGSFIIEPTFNGSKEIQKSFDQLFHDFALTIALVFFVLFTFFGLRQSIIAALAIPLTFLGTFLVMKATGISINFIALFSLLLALGILVDNAIVIISAMASYERTKKFSPDEVGLLVWRDFRTVIFTTTITTVWAFLPLLLASGIIGEFIKPIPIVVSASLAISAAVALLIVIPMMALLLKGNFPRRVIILIFCVVFAFGAVVSYFLIPAGTLRIPLFILSLLILLFLFIVSKSLKKEIHEYETSHFKAFFEKFHAFSKRGFFDFNPLAHRYERLITRILASKTARRKTLAALIIFMIFSYALVPTGYVVNEFFPADDIDFVYVSVELPKSTSLEESENAIRPLLDTLRHYPDTRFVLAEMGATPPTDNFVIAKDVNNLLFTLVLTPKEERDKTSGDIVVDLNRQFGNYNQGKLSASQLSGGPPAGSDLQITLLGDDLSLLETYGQQIQDHLREVPGTAAIAASIEEGSSKIVFVPSKEKFADLNISETDTSFLLRTLGSGFTIKNDARIGGNDKQDVIIRFNGGSSLSSPGDLGTLSLNTERGNIPLLALGEFTMKPNPTLITREDGKRTLSVTSSVQKGYSVSTLNKELEKYADSLSLPEGYSWKTGGVNDENNKSVQSILMAMLLSAVLIFGTMAVQFNSFRKALIVLLVIPLAVSGVFILFAISGTPLSFPALIGILALFGIVVNNSIIMVDKINRNMDAGLPLDQAITEGAASRLEPILLTALTTIIGLIPITLSDPIWQGLGGAIIAGLTFSGVAKLFFIPIIYRVMFDKRGAESAPLKEA